MVAVWLRSTKTDVVKLLSFLVHNMAVMPVARAHVCACVFKPSAGTELECLKPSTHFIGSKNVPDIPCQK